MADSEKIGTVWHDDEVDLIVADYFAMLALEQANQSYVKSHHSSELMAKIGRTHRSVEYKHMNISAVLSELGYPTIKGYKPKENYQKSILDAIERHLARQLRIGARSNFMRLRKPQLYSSRRLPSWGRRRSDRKRSNDWFASLMQVSGIFATALSARPARKWFSTTSVADSD